MFANAVGYWVESVAAGMALIGSAWNVAETSTSVIEPNHQAE